MKKCDFLQEYFAKIPSDIHEEIDLSFAIVDRIYDILERQNKTQKDLAKALGKSESEISKWMRGTHNFTTRTLAKISAVLGEKIIEVAGTQSTISVNNYVIYGSAYYTQKVGQSRNVHIIAGENKSEPNIWEQNIACIPNGSIC